MSLELQSALIRLRLDAVLISVMTIAACAYCHGYIRRRGAVWESSRGSAVVILTLALVGAAMAEWAGWFLGQTAPGSLPMVILGRAAVLGSVTVIGALGLFSATRFALLRAELRGHAETGRLLHLAKTAADDASRAKSDFLAVMSHEIRTPLNAVMGFANLLSETRLDAAQRSYLGTITSEGSRLTSLINDVLDLTKIEQGRLTLERLPYAPAETANEVLRLLSARALEKNLELRLEAQLAEPLLVCGDPLRFRQVLVNLVDNAIKFTPQGSITLFLNWTPPETPGGIGRLGVRVRDTGIGIAAAKLKDLFQMFMQADLSTTRRYGGSGLGLAICQRLVTLMGGKISAESTTGGGSEFFFTLPVAAIGTPADTMRLDPEPETVLGRRPRILVVDDMETNRFLLEVFLRRHGFEPEVAAGGEEAVRLATAHRYDAILMDLQMPDVDGYSAAQRIRAAESVGRRTPIIALTASIGRGTRDKCLAAGMDEHLTKPLDLKRFKVLLNRFVSGTAVVSTLAQAAAAN